MRVDYARIHVADYLIRFFSSLILWMVLFWILIFVVVFLSFSFAYWFGERTGKWSLGFLIIAGFYILLAIFFFIFRKAIIVRPFTRLILQQMDLETPNDPKDEKE
jgi:hypothetical protein